MASTAASTTGTTGTAWSPARVYLVASGVFLIAASLAGFALSTAFPSSAGAVETADNPHILGIFETNGWHNLAATISGTISLAFASRPQWARTGAFVKGSMYTVVTIAIAVWGPETFLIASNAADQVVHGTMAVAGLGTALAT
ncbi:MAG TPA: DUF4383 domain-containing protein, partial [Actinomycetota bacterium]|nr:DUF4383 domain-containing protein [Actinomycetota bacterium]